MIGSYSNFDVSMSHWPVFFFFNQPVFISVTNATLVLSLGNRSLCLPLVGAEMIRNRFLYASISCILFNVLDQTWKLLFRACYNTYNWQQYLNVFSLLQENSLSLDHYVYMNYTDLIHSQYSLEKSQSPWNQHYSWSFIYI